MTKDLHEEVTNKILARMEKGDLFWHKPWQGSASFAMPRNSTTGNNYRGINIPLLWIAAEDNGFETQDWASFNQWREKKQMVAKGQKGTTVIYYDTIERQKDDKVEKIPFIKASYVFNRCQLQGYETQPREERPLIERLEHADTYIMNIGASIYHDGGNRAYYSRTSDEIHLPPRDAFKDKESLYSVTLHELVHYTGAEKRLNRQKGKKFGDKAYAYEELVAELGAAFECAGLEITNEPREDHAAYLQNWLDVLKSDPKAIFTAASEASKAVEFLDSFQHKLVTADFSQPRA